MNTKNLKNYRERLFALRSRLRDDVVQMAGVALEETSSAANGKMSMAPIHMAENGTDTFDREFTLQLVRNEDGMLEQVKEALKRMKNGLYGVCAGCKTKIPQARLSAIPYAIHCVKCASHLESHSAHSLRS